VSDDPVEAVPQGRPVHDVSRWGKRIHHLTRHLPPNRANARS
jgi:hypothetical protein